jgi:hypothetical protein
VARSSFGKLQRDRDKRAKAAAKRELRQGRSSDTGDEAVDETAEEQAPQSELSTEDVLARVAELHERFDAGQIAFDDFEEQKAALLGQLSVD